MNQTVCGSVTVIMNQTVCGCVTVTMNQTVSPCEDFWHYACGGWAAANEGYSSQWGRRGTVVNLRLVNLLSQPITPDDSQAVQVRAELRCV